MAFAHNGSIGGFRRIQRDLLTSLPDGAFELIEGTTDAEHLFALVVDELTQRDDLPPTDALAESLVAAIERVLTISAEAHVAEEIDLNAAITDGHHAVACRYAVPETAESLFVRTGARYVVEEGQGRMVEIRDELNSVIVSSEPLTEDGGWAKVPANALVIVRSARAVEVKPLIANGTLHL